MKLCLNLYSDVNQLYLAEFIEKWNNLEEMYLSEEKEKSFIEKSAIILKKIALMFPIPHLVR